MSTPPNHRSAALALLKQGNSFRAQRAWPAAEQAYRQAITQFPQLVEAHFHLGMVLHETSRFSEALQRYDAALIIQPKLPEVWYAKALVLKALGQNEEAERSYAQAVKIRANFPEAHYNRGNLLKQLNRPEEALQSYQLAVKYRPEFVEALFNLANLLLARERFSDAVKLYDQVLRIQKNHKEVWCNRGIALRRLKRPTQAIESFKQSISIDTSYANAYTNMGVALLDISSVQEALRFCAQAVELAPTEATYIQNYAVVLARLRRFDEAIAQYQKAMQIQSNTPDLFFNCAVAFFESNQFVDAVVHLDQALIQNPDREAAYGLRLHCKMLLCDWHEYAAQVDTLITQIQAKKYPSPMFPFISVSDDLQSQCLLAQRHALTTHPESAALGPIKPWPRHARIRVAYLSSDFQESPAGYNMVGFFEAHDRTRFETYAVSFGPDVDSPLRQRLKGAFAHFLEVRNLSDLDIARQLRALQIDIAVDIQGPTQNERGGIFALRCASIQVNNFGWTSGAPYMDYIIADPVVLPPEHETFYTEKVVRLPHTFFATDNKKIIAEYTPTRSEAGLPETGFVFCAFNNSYKITPPVFDCWMRILKQVPESVLWLREKNPTTAENLKKEAEARGVDAARLIFAPRTESMADHLARHRLADLFLDNFPFGAQTTASDALWAGLPIVTRTGEAMMSRVAASLLTAVGLPELITTNEADYEALVLELATHPDKLKAIRDKLARNRLTTPLFNTEDYATHFQKAYLAMLDA